MQEHELESMVPAPKPGDRVTYQHYQTSWKFDNRQAHRMQDRHIWGPDLTINNEQQHYGSYKDNVGRVFAAAAGSHSGMAIRPVAAGANATHGKAYTSGILTTRFTHAQQYGRFEARLRVPYGAGIWPAFWMLPEFDQWPAAYPPGVLLPEIDIMEAIGDALNRYYATVHYREFGNQQKIATTHQCAASANLHTQSHVYGLEWTPVYMAFYIDDRYIMVIPTRLEFHRPFHMIMNVAVGGDWPGQTITPRVGELSLEIDRWRAMQFSLPSGGNNDVVRRLLKIRQSAGTCVNTELDTYIRELLS